MLWGSLYVLLASLLLFFCLLKYNWNNLEEVIKAKNIRIFFGDEVWIEKSVWVSLFDMCQVMPNSDPAGQIFLSAPNSHERFFFLHTFWSAAFDFNVEVAINESHSYILTSATLKVDVVCDVAMMSAANVLTTELRGLLYNHCIDNTW